MKPNDLDTLLREKQNADQFSAAPQTETRLRYALLNAERHARPRLGYQRALALAMAFALVFAAGALIMQRYQQPQTAPAAQSVESQTHIEPVITPAPTSAPEAGEAHETNETPDRATYTLGPDVTKPLVVDATEKDVIIRLMGATIEAADCPAITLTGSGNVAFWLMDGTETTLRGGIDQNGSGFPAIDNSALQGTTMFFCTEMTGGHLCTERCGTLRAFGTQYAPAIGGVKRSGEIQFSSGNIYATGGNYAAAIGCGRLGTANDIYLFSGNITARGGQYGAGLGGGYGSTGGTFHLYDGQLRALGGQGAEGVGGGANAAAPCTVITNVEGFTRPRAMLLQTGDSMDAAEADAGMPVCGQEISALVDGKRAVLLTRQPYTVGQSQTAGRVVFEATFVNDETVPVTYEWITQLKNGEHFQKAMGPEGPFTLQPGEERTLRAAYYSPEADASAAGPGYTVRRTVAGSELEEYGGVFAAGSALPFPEDAEPKKTTALSKDCEFRLMDVEASETSLYVLADLMFQSQRTADAFVAQYQEGGLLPYLYLADPQRVLQAEEAWPTQPISLTDQWTDSLGRVHISFHGYALGLKEPLRPSAQDWVCLDLVSGFPLNIKRITAPGNTLSYPAIF